MALGLAQNAAPIAPEAAPVLPSSPGVDLFQARRLLERHPVMNMVPEACVAEVAAVSIARQFQAGELLSRESDPAEYYWLLLKGSVRAFCTSSTGQAVTVQLFGAPAAWAENQLLHEQAHTESCVAIDRCLALMVPKREFLRIIWKYQALMMNVLRDASGRLLVASQRERCMAFGDVTERVADLLMSYVRLYGVPADGGTMIRISLSQSDLANDLGIALKSVSRSFKKLLADGVLEKRGTKLVVTRLDALQRLAKEPGIDWTAGRKLAGR